MPRTRIIDSKDMGLVNRGGEGDEYVNHIRFNIYHDFQEVMAWVTVAPDAGSYYGVHRRMAATVHILVVILNALVHDLGPSWLAWLREGERDQT